MREIIKKIHQVLIFTYIFEGFRRYHVIVGGDTAALEFTRSNDYPTLDGHLK